MRRYFTPEELRRLLRRRRRYTVLVAAIVLGAFAMSWLNLLVFGTSLGGDAGRYVNRGDQILAYWFVEDAAVPSFDPWNTMYLLSNVLIAGARVGTEAADALLIGLNILSFVGMILFMTRTWLGSVHVRPTFAFAIACVILFFGMPGEVTKYLGLHHSSDILFLSVSGVALASLVRGWEDVEGRYLAWAVVLGLVALFLRPAGLVTFSSIVFGVLLRSTVFRSKIVFAAALVVPAFVALLAWPYLVHDIVVSGRDVSRGMDYVIANYKLGAVVSGYEPSYVSGAKEYLDFVYITVLRCFYYVIPFRIEYSAIHFLTNGLYMAFLVILLARGWAYWKRTSRAGATVPFILLTYIVWMTLLHAMTQVEDWRYELPLWAGLWVLAGYGMASRQGDHSSGDDAVPGIDREVKGQS